MSAFKDLTGKKFGILTAINCVGSNKHKVKEWLCRCECGKEKIIIMGFMVLKIIIKDIQE